MAEQVSTSVQDNLSHSHFPHFITFKSGSLETERYELDRSCPEQYDSYFEQKFDRHTKIAYGKRSKVYCARFLEDGKYYTVKKMHLSCTSCAQFLNEVKYHEMLSGHPNIVKFNRAWSENGRFYVLTELCVCSLLDYATLARYDIPTEDLLFIFADIVQGLSRMHKKGLIHSDLRLENILISRNRICKLGDFGVTVRKRCDAESDNAEAKISHAKVSEMIDIKALGNCMIELMGARSLDVEKEPDMNDLEKGLVKLVLWCINVEKSECQSIDGVACDPTLLPFINKRNVQFADEQFEADSYLNLSQLDMENSKVFENARNEAENAVGTIAEDSFCSLDLSFSSPFKRNGEKNANDLTADEERIKSCILHSSRSIYLEDSYDRVVNLDQSASNDLTLQPNAGLGLYLCASFFFQEYVTDYVFRDPLPLPLSPFDTSRRYKSVQPSSNCDEDMDDEESQSNNAVGKNIESILPPLLPFNETRRYKSMYPNSNCDEVHRLETFHSTPNATKGMNNARSQLSYVVGKNLDSIMPVDTECFSYYFETEDDKRGMYSGASVEQEDAS